MKPGGLAGERIESFDVMRGIDMFWLAGGQDILHALLPFAPASFASAVATQFEHADWAGFHFYDLGFPAFLMLVGMVLPFSMARHIEKGGSGLRLYGRIFRRLLLLMLLGLVYNGLFWVSWHDLRVAGVLQRIGVSYVFASLIVMHFKPRGQALIAAILLAGYWGLVALVPVPGVGRDVLTPAGNLAGYVDRQWLPGPFCCYVYGDSEGILPTIPAISTVLIGALAGAWLRTPNAAGRKIAGLVAAGGLMVAAGLAWSRWFPIVKNLWTGSFALLTGGLVLLLLAFFYWTVDIRGHRRLAFFFTVIGANAITIYVLRSQVSLMTVVHLLGYGNGERFGVYWMAVLRLVDLAASWLLLLFLYRKKVFLRV